MKQNIIKYKNSKQLIKIILWFILKPGMFNKPKKREVEGFKYQTEIWPKLNRDNIKNNLMIKIKCKNITNL